MNETDLRALYEKLYFLEVEGREQIHARLQLPLSLIVAIIGVAAFLLQNFDYEKGPWSLARWSFVAGLVIGAVALMRATWCFGRALFGNVYHFLPTAKQSDEYHRPWSTYTTRTPTKTSWSPTQWRTILRKDSLKTRHLTLK